jgi:hypothetical protein
MVRLFKYACILVFLAMQAQAHEPSKMTKVAVLLPYAPEHEKTSEEIAEAMQTGLDDLQADDLNITILALDQKPKELTKELKELAPDVIISTLNHPETRSKVLDYARSNNICVLALNNDTNLKNSKECVLLMPPMLEDRALVTSIFAAQNGYELNMLLPNNLAESQKIISALERQPGVALNYLQLYNPQKIDDEWYLYDFFNSVRNKSAKTKQAIVINDVEIVQYVHDFQRHNPDTLVIVTDIAESLEAVKEHHLKNTWFSSVKLDKFAKFRKHFNPSTQRKATEMSALAYDTLAILYYVQQNKHTTKPKKADFLDPQGFAGLTGTIRFSADGANQRLFEILTIGFAGQIKKVANSSQGFRAVPLE